MRGEQWLLSTLSLLKLSALFSVRSYVFYEIPREDPMKYGLNKQTVRCTENLLNGRGILSMCTNTWREDVKETEIGSFQWFPVQDKTQWAQTEVPFEHQETLIFCEDDGSLAKAVQRFCRISFLGDIQMPDQLALKVPAWAGRLVPLTSRCCFQPQQFDSDRYRV